MIEISFYISVFLAVYPYLGYPAIIWFIGRWRPQAVSRSHVTPSVSILIAAYNESHCIKETIKNKLEQDYPKECLEIIVISDESTDGTDEIVKTFASNGVTLLRQLPRQGKASALNMAARYARGDVLIFSDANSMFRKDAVSRLVENFADPEVGYVTGRLQYVTADPSLAGDGCGAYMKYENGLRLLETMFGSVIGVNGGIDAMRRELYTEIPTSLITDFVLPLHVLKNGKRVVFDGRVESYEVPNSAVEAEFRMRVRVALRALHGLAYMSGLLNPIRYPRTSFSLISHKLLRYMTPVFLFIALFSNVWLALDDGWYQLLLLPHLTLYALGVLGAFYKLPGILGKLSLVPSYFLVTNAAFTLALVRYLRGDVMAVWKPRVG